MTLRHAVLPLVLGVVFIGPIEETAAQSLDGVWEITAVIDDGRVVNPTDVLLNCAADGRVPISGQTVELVVPMTYQRKKLPSVADSPGMEGPLKAWAKGPAVAQALQ